MIDPLDRCALGKHEWRMYGNMPIMGESTPNYTMIIGYRYRWYCVYCRKFETTDRLDEEVSE